jgi:hypothetical protein
MNHKFSLKLKKNEMLAKLASHMMQEMYLLIANFHHLGTQRKSGAIGIKKISNRIWRILHNLMTKRGEVAIFLMDDLNKVLPKYTKRICWMPNHYSM